ncbi:uncharacterized protein LOC135849960 isoform X2 [Planococcus citri]|uniref:uncharacterized protein LOC135849960 isoform X2 n=1 Tax=Planococcus citri TaxID=170843 RepID=UPI0031F7DB00
MQGSFLSKPSLSYVKNYGSSLMKLYGQRCSVVLSVSKIHTPAEFIDHSRNTTHRQWTDTHISNVLPHFWNGTGTGLGNGQCNKFISFSPMPLNHACRVYSTKSGNNYDDGIDYKKKYFDLLNAIERKEAEDARNEGEDARNEEEDARNEEEDATEEAEEADDATSRENAEIIEEIRKVYRVLIGPEVYDLMDPSEADEIGRKLVHKRCQKVPIGEDVTKETEDARNEEEDATEEAEDPERAELIKKIRKLNRVLIGPEVYDLMDPLESDELAEKLINKSEATDGCT